MQAIRTVVIFMSFLLVTGIGVLFYGIMNDWHKKNDDADVVNTGDVPSVPSYNMISSIEPTLSLEAFGDWEVPLPVGAVIRDMESKNGMLFLRYVSGGRGGVVVLDLSTKTHLGTIKFK
ncbi:hypothetical protein [Curvivirga aplysinae]|uniref:hypothetical protein n=1 Tax=Curvivirga aplysinae TaxID=2529852 RepID=UPI0012BC5EFE|nr:hypothetical protein [Curvivirga aplysinae]MTI09841.1 hypothetical protein [Curvivirga aplysinae]